MSDIPTEPLTEPISEPGVETPSTYPGARTEVKSEKSFLNSGDIVSIIAIVSICVVALCCIGSCALIGFAFMQNPPW